MKVWCFLLAVLFLAGSATCACLVVPNHHKPDKGKHSKAFAISGTVQQSFAYCGGARPSQKMIDDQRRPRPFAGKKFYVRRGATNDAKAEIINTFEADSNGLFKLQLPAGTYSILLEEQRNEINPEDYNKNHQKLDEACAKEWWAKPYYLLVVKDHDIEGLNFLFSHRCFITSDIPCITYTGPMPP